MEKDSFSFSQSGCFSLQSLFHCSIWDLQEMVHKRAGAGYISSSCRGGVQNMVCTVEFSKEFVRSESILPFLVCWVPPFRHCWVYRCDHMGFALFCFWYWVSHIPKAYFQLSMWSGIILDFWSFSLSTLNTRIADMYHHAQFVWCYTANPRPRECWASTLPTGDTP